MNKLAPIILFVYNRPRHTERCLNSLYKNYLAKDSTLYIFCDGVKENASESDINNNAEVLEIIKKKQWCKKVLITKQERNVGLRESVIKGVNHVLNSHEYAIVIEDDLVLSNYFLDYMNKGLNLYKDDLSVSQISAYSFKLDVENIEEDAYFLPLITTWGWATWRRVWEKIDFNGSDYKEVLSNKQSIKAFNLDNSYDYYSMLMNQIGESKKISSWGIMFWLHSFKNNSKTLFPKYTLVSNTGFDGSGTHKANVSNDDDFDESNRVNSFPKESVIHVELYNKLKVKLRKSEFSLKRRLFNLYKKLFIN